MSVDAAQTQFRQEMVALFETRSSLYQGTATTEAVIKGNQAEFLVHGAGTEEATTRGVDGLIPAGDNSNTQSTITLTEWHRRVTKTSFNIFASQGNQRQAMAMDAVVPIHRKMDDLVRTELATGTVDTGAATTFSLALALKSRAILQAAKVPADRNVFCAITPVAEAYMLQVPAFTSMDYVSRKPMENPDGWDDKPRLYNWLGINWFVDPDLPGVGTNAAKCFMWHRSAIGAAMNTGGMSSEIGYNGEHDYSWARASVFMGAGLLQNAGVVVINHDDSAYVGA